jgi:predicted phosphodiesterase
MKIAVCSDLHLEFGDIDFANDQNADVLILGGDNFVAEDIKNFSRGVFAISGNKSAFSSIKIIQ